ncbi:MAG TPA: phosphotransferase family protein [Dehalococcoidia bacterium]|nr:phosphotransferase family protein [Dehalococcoidia bacterium]
MSQAETLTGLVDVASLEAYLRRALPAPDAAAPLVVHKHTAGFSNETFYLERGVQRWVMRRPPRGPLLPSAHDVGREYRVLAGLHGTAARVPRPLVLCEDVEVIGAPFYVMERVDGIVIREQLPDQFDAVAERRRLGEEMIDTLVEIHSVDWRAAGLESLGRPQGYLERQLRRWSGQLDLTLPRTRPLPRLVEVSDWLKTRLPASGPATVVHGDFKIDNVLFAPRAPARLLAALDWEMATLGDPLADVGYFMTFWGPTGDPDEGTPEAPLPVYGLPGFLSREEMVARYEERSGRAMREIQFYMVLALWKLAIILEGLYAGFLVGTAANARAAEMEFRVPRLVDRMHRFMAGEL